MNELVDGIMDGSSITQVSELSTRIPGELDDLYRYIMAKRKPKYVREVHIMLQIVLHVRRLLSLEELIAITDVALRHPYQKVSMEDMQQRVRSRCGGLLDILPVHKEDYGYNKARNSVSSTLNTDELDVNSRMNRAPTILEVSFTPALEDPNPLRIRRSSGTEAITTRAEFRIQLLH